MAQYSNNHSPHPLRSLKITIQHQPVTVGIGKLSAQIQVVWDRSNRVPINVECDLGGSIGALHGQALSSSILSIPARDGVIVAMVVPAAGELEITVFASWIGSRMFLENMYRIIPVSSCKVAAQSREGIGAARASRNRAIIGRVLMQVYFIILFAVQLRD